jgi:hypothetical protein
MNFTQQMGGDETNRGSHHTLLALLLIVVCTVASFVPVFRCEFVYRDDDATLFNNPLLKPPTPHTLVRYWTWPAMKLYKPVTYTVWAGLAWLAGSSDLPGGPIQLDPLPFHATNLLVHVASAILAFFILKRCVQSVWAACIGSLVFAIHPVQVESVAWASGLKDVLAGCFSLAAILQYLRFAETPPQDPRRRWRYLAVIVWLYLGQLAKPSAVVVPVVVFAIDWLILRTPPRQVLRRVTPIFLLCLPVMILASAIQQFPPEADLLHRPLIALNTFSFYLWKIAWPAGLAPDYALTATRVLHSPWIRWCWVIPLAVVIALLLARRRPVFLAAAIIFISGILPVLGLVTFGFEAQSTVADHYLYLPMLGIGLVVAAILSRVRLPVAAVCGVILLVPLGVRTFQQASVWHDTISLFAHNERIVPWSFRPPTQVGFALQLQGHIREAEPEFRRALALTPAAVTYMNLGANLLLQGRPGEAIDPLQRSLELDPNQATVRLALAKALYQTNRPEEAAAQLRQIPPDDPAASQAADLLRSAPNR